MGAEREAWLLLYCPLWGISFEMDTPDLAGVGAGLLAGTTLVYVPFEAEWRFIQQGDVFAESNGAGSMPGGIPLCLVERSAAAIPQSLDDRIGRLGRGMLDAAEDAVLALRLYQDGWFLQPDLAELVFTDGEHLLRREPGPYRQAFMSGVPRMLGGNYSLRLSDLTAEASRPGPVTRVFEKIAAYRATGGNTAVDTALDNFRRSFGYQMMGVQRLAHLFVSLDALFGGMSARRIGAVDLRPRFFRRRLEAALTAAVGDDLSDEASWLDSRARVLRNAIAHGDSIETIVDADVGAVRVQRLLRPLVQAVLTFASRWASNSRPIIERFRLPATCSFGGAYNKVLEARARGIDDGLDLLRQGDRV